MLAGKVDSLKKTVVAGWVRTAPGQQARVWTTLGSERIETTADLPRKQAKPGDPVFGFRLVLPREFPVAALADGTLTIEAGCGAETITLGLWEPLAIAATLAGFDAAMLTRALPFLDPDRRLLLAAGRAEEAAPVQPVTFSQAEFNEAFYQEAYPDVREAVRQGTVTSGYDHYLRFGRGEGRKFMTTPPD